MEDIENIRARKAQLTRSLKGIVNHAEESEKSIEAYLIKRVREEGGLALKFTSFTQTGFPDRLALLPCGLTAWVELKSKGAKPTRLQQIRHDKLRSLGFPVYVISGKDQVDSMLDEMMSMRYDL